MAASPGLVKSLLMKYASPWESVLVMKPKPFKVLNDFTVPVENWPLPVVPGTPGAGGGGGAARCCFAAQWCPGTIAPPADGNCRLAPPATWTFFACNLPSWEGTMMKRTVAPASKPAGSAMSALPNLTSPCCPGTVMKPYPCCSLKDFTRPVLVETTCCKCAVDGLVRSTAWSTGAAKPDAMPLPATSPAPSLSASHADWNRRSRACNLPLLATTVKSINWPTKLAPGAPWGKSSRVKRTSSVSDVLDKKP
mmetsp:Transcript_30481/g.86994  ORF Transcript_30481/g.86994 Transcript_30481/m.86994 type:complete len:251 (-) Transcript_30481:294-1046(-)